MIRRRGRRLRALPLDVAARVDALPRDVARGNLDIAIARYMVDRATLAEVIAALATIPTQGAPA